MTGPGSPSPSLAAARLKAAFIEATKTETLGGSNALSELAKPARGCIVGSPPAEKMLAFVLAKFFQSFAADWDERPVRAHETAAFLREAHQPLLQATECLEGTRNSGEIIGLAIRIIDLETELLP